MIRNTVAKYFQLLNHQEKKVHGNFFFKVYLESLVCFPRNTDSTWPCMSWVENSRLVRKAITLLFCVVIVPIRTFTRSQPLITLWTRWVCGWCWLMKEWLKMKLSAPPHRQPWYLENQMGIDLQWLEIWLWSRAMSYSSRYLCTNFLQVKEQPPSRFINEIHKEHKMFLFY